MADRVKFGTSGVRGLASALMAGQARHYTRAFVGHMRRAGHLEAGRVFLGRDLRASSPAIAHDVAHALKAAGLAVADAEVVPTPALALAGMAAGCPAIMVTGSHIPADRNGLKFFRPDGEIDKNDEAAIVAALDEEETPQRTTGVGREDVGDAVSAAYRARYRELLPANALAGWRIGVFEHSTVLRACLESMLEAFGAQTVALGRSERFVPVDTEAFDDAPLRPLGGWIHEFGLDAIVSADGDGDRPLLMDAQGHFVRGDALGLTCARALGADGLAIPVSANSAIEAAVPSARVARTRIGSPYVIVGMNALAGDGAARVMGFEANGGTLLGTDFPAQGLVALPTRDAMLPLLLALGAAARENTAIAPLIDGLGLKVARADRVADFAHEAAQAFLNAMAQPGTAQARLALLGTIAQTSATDGLRFHLETGEIVHFRGSGNAPEMRCYVEADTAARARHLLDFGCALLEDAK